MRVQKGYKCRVRRVAVWVPLEVHWGTFAKAFVPLCTSKGTFDLKILYFYILLLVVYNLSVLFITFYYYLSEKISKKIKIFLFYKNVYL